MWWLYFAPISVIYHSFHTLKRGSKMRLFLLINPTYQMPFQLYQMAFNALKKKNRGLCSAKNGLGLEKKVVHQSGNQTLYHRIDKCYQFFEKLRLPHFRVKLRNLLEFIHYSWESSRQWEVEAVLSLEMRPLMYVVWYEWASTHNTRKPDFWISDTWPLCCRLPFFCLLWKRLLRTYV